MGLVDKLKNAGKALALAGGLGGMAYNSGCTPLAIVGGAAIVAQSNRDAAEKQAKGGDVDASNSDPHLKPSTPFGNLIIASCNYIRDFDNDNEFDYPKEFVNIKNKFSMNEIITVILGSDRIIGDIEYKLLNNRGDIIEEFKGMNYGVLYAQYNDNKTREDDLPKGQINFLKMGNYRSLWYSKGQLIAMHDFSVE